MYSFLCLSVEIKSNTKSRHLQLFFSFNFYLSVSQEQREEQKVGGFHIPVTEMNEKGDSNDPMFIWFVFVRLSLLNVAETENKSFFREIYGR